MAQDGRPTSGEGGLRLTEGPVVTSRDLRVMVSFRTTAEDGFDPTASAHLLRCCCDG